MSTADNFEKQFTGRSVKVDTTQTPVAMDFVPGTIGFADAPYSSCTIVADTNVTYGTGGSTTVYADGDILFYSDGYQIWDSTGGLMLGAEATTSNNKTGAHRAAPQAVTFIKVSDTLSASVTGGIASGAGNSTGAIYWAFFNGMYNGIRAGVIDMNGNGGLGKFFNHLNISQSFGPLTGELQDSICDGRMVSFCCTVDGKDAAGLLIKNNNWGGVTANNKYSVYRFSTISSMGAPELYGGTSVTGSPVTTVIGAITANNDAGRMGVFSITKADMDLTSAGHNKFKFATIIQEYVGDPGMPNDVAAIQVFNLDASTGTILDASAFGAALAAVPQLDRGPIAWPQIPGTPSRYFSMHSCFSPDSTYDNATIYHGWFDGSSVPAGELKMRYVVVDAANIMTNASPVNYGHIEDGAGANIWNGQNGPSRIIAGMWMDHVNDRILFLCPQQIDIMNLAVVPAAVAWSTDYWEIYGDPTSGPSTLNIGVINGASAPQTATFDFEGTPTPGATMIRYGAPAQHICTGVASTPFILVDRCDSVGTYTVDNNKQLWKTDVRVSEVRMNLITGLQVTNVRGISFNMYTAMAYIWDSPTSNTLAYQVFHPDYNTVSTSTNIAANATYDSYTAITNTVGLVPVGSTEIDVTHLCKYHWFLGKAPGVNEKYSFGLINTSTNTVTNYSPGIEIDLATFSGSALTGMTPVSIAGALPGDIDPAVAGTNGYMYIAIGPRIVAYDINGATYTLLANSAPFDYNDIFLQYTGAGVNGYTLRGTCGAAGSQKTYEIDQGTGATTLIGNNNTTPGAFQWPEESQGTAFDSSYRNWSQFPLKLSSGDVNYTQVENYCNAGSGGNTIIWTWDNLNIAGCFSCVPPGTKTYHTNLTSCDIYSALASTYSSCRNCLDDVDNDCAGFLPCCAIGSNGYAQGPLNLPAVTTDAVVNGGYYSVSSNGSTPECSVAFTPNQQILMSFNIAMDGGNNNVIEIDNWNNNTTSIPALTANSGVVYSQGNLNDIAFDKHNNLTVTQTNNNIWFSAINGYESPPVTFNTGFVEWTCADYDYTATGHLVVAYQFAGVAYFAKYVQTLTSITLAGAANQNGGISVGHDISVDFNSGDYWLIGDSTNSGGLNDLMTIDDATGAAVLVADLEVICAYTAGEFTCGIESVRAGGSTTRLFVISALADVGPTTTYTLKLRELNSSGTAEVNQITLLNPITNTTVWNQHPNGMTVNDLCEKWLQSPDNVNPAIVQYTDCADCLSNVSTANCCFVLTNCTSGAVVYSQSNLTAYVGSVVEDAAGECWTVDNSIACVSPAPFTVAAGPFNDCTACTTPIVCYKLTKCGDPTDVIYTTAILSPLIPGLVGQTVQLSGENFCREVAIDPSCNVPQVAVTIASTPTNCGECNFHIILEHCDTGANLLVDYATSLAFIPFLGTADAHDVTLGGVAQAGCWKAISIGGPSAIAYPTGAIVTTYADCTTCNSSGTCFALTHCCGQGYITTQIVGLGSGVVAGDIGQVIEAEVTVNGIVYPGCWTVSQPGGLDCSQALPNIDVTVLNSTTIGSPIGTNCADCPTTPNPCPTDCDLLVTCVPGAGPDITISPGDAAIVGTDAVTLIGSPLCYQICPSGNSLHGTQMFFGDQLGIDYSTGMPLPNLSGASLMADYNSVGATDYSTMGGATCCSNQNATINGTAYAKGDIMFYTDGHLIYDSTHTLMLDDTGAAAGLSGGDPLGTGGYEGRVFPQQGALYFPKTDGGSTGGLYHQWYVVCNTVKDGPIYWSIVDMTLNGGKGRVVSATKNTVLIANGISTEHMCVTNTDNTGNFYFYFRKKMSSSFDYVNQAVFGIPIVNGVWGVEFTALDFALNNGLQTFTLKQQCSGEMLVGPNNKVFAHCGIWVDNTAGANDGCMVVAWSLNMSNGTMTGPGDPVLTQTNAWNGGAWNGVYQMLGAIGTGQFGGSGGNWGDSAGQIAITQNSTHVYWANDAVPSSLQSAGTIKRMTVDSWSDLLPDPVYDNWTTRGAPDDTQVNGWKYPYWPGEDGPSIGDIALMPNGMIGFAMQNVNTDDLYPGKVGTAPGPAGNISACIGVIADPEDPIGANIASQIDGNGGMGPLGMSATIYNIGGRVMGTKFPTYLWGPCDCDPANIQAILITNNYPDCSDANCVGSPGGQDGFEITECDCTGGGAVTNLCDISDPANQPAAMVANGKSWSPTCQAPGPQRMQCLVDAVQNLGTQLVPGVAQQLDFTYSFCAPGTQVPGQSGAGVTLSFEQGPTTANPNGRTPGCAVYAKTYTIDIAQFKAEIAGCFQKMKEVIEGRFNTTCGYGADLTVTFTDVGVESAAAGITPAIGIATAQANGTYTDMNGVSNIGDFRFGYGPCNTSCSSLGSKLGVLAYAYSPDPNMVPGNGGAGVRNTSWNSFMMIDANEDWRKGMGVPDPVVADSFDLQLVVTHELGHAFGLGHDIFWDQALCTALTGAPCGCPCYQGAGNSTCGNVVCGTANSDALMGPWATTAQFSSVFPTGLAGASGIYEQRAFCGIYGNPSANYACEDEYCLTGCTPLVYHSTDFPNLTPVAPGIMDWDDGTPAGLRCWDVQYLPSLPSGYVDTTPVVPVSSTQGADCLDCTTQANQCYTLNLCACNTILGVPQTVVTTTDLSGYCNGTVGNGTVVEIDLYPGACYEIDCTPQPCPPTGAVAVVVTQDHLDCTDCCAVNQLCYELCPCAGSTPSSDSCSALTEIMVGTSGGAGDALQFISIPANGLNNTVMVGHKYGNNIQPNGTDFCPAPGGGHYREFYAPFPNNGTIAVYMPGTTTPPAGMSAGFATWSDLLDNLILLGVAGVTNPGTPYFGTNTLINAHYGIVGPGVSFSIASSRCDCISSTSCITVTNDLSGVVGSVVDLVGPVTVPGLDDSTCYLPGVCGPCSSTPGAACVPAGTVTINNVYVDCLDCDSGNPLDCYKLINCTDPNDIIDNVCPNVDIDNAFLAGEIVQVNGTTECYYIDISQNCDPLTCIIVTVDTTYASCATCSNGGQQWSCVGPCDCQLGPAAGWPSEAQCLANINPNTGVDCCPSTSWDCDTSCNCVPAQGSSGAFATLTDCQTAVNNPNGGANCCVNTPVSFDCGQFTPGSTTLTCQDPGNGSGLFASLVDCNAAIASNTQPCYVESWNCIIDASGVSTCIDPGDGSGTWNNGNGGLAACAACNGCVLNPFCTGALTTWDCDPTAGCVTVIGGTGQYSSLADCAINCASYDPDGGVYEGDCVNCIEDPDMQILMEKVADMCDDCNPPFGLEANEVICDDCFGNSNLYVIFDMSSTFSGNAFDKLTKISQFKTNVVIPAFNQLKAEYPQYGGHLYIIPGPNVSHSCTNYNGTGQTVPSSSGTPYEDWLAWATYPITGNAGANGPMPNPFTGSTLPNANKIPFQSTIINGVGGAPLACGNYLITMDSLVKDILILPGSYATDGFTQLNPWQDATGYEGFSDPYHEFEGGDRSAITMIICDEATIGYYTANNNGVVTNNVFTNPIGTCGNPLDNGVPATDWNNYGLDAGGNLTTTWKLHYDNYMDAYRYGIDLNGNVNVGAAQLNEATNRVMLYLGSDNVPSPQFSDSIRDMFYHIYQAIGGKPGTVNLTGHVSCSDYYDVPAAFGMQAYCVTDPTIPNMYMGASGGGDPTHTTGYKGGSLSNYGMDFYIPDIPIDQMDANRLFELWKEYLSDCV